MSFSKALSLALAVIAAHASPIINNPSRVVPRQEPPAPSSYPLGDACGHEWQYLNFNPELETDKAHLETLHDVLCIGEMRAVSSYGEGAAERALAPYKRYFAVSDEEDDFQTHVKDVLHLIAGESSTDGAVGSIVGTFIIDNLDFAVNNPAEDDCTIEGTLAYTLVDTLDNREKIHFCDPAWTRPSVADVDCGALDPYPSTKMDSFSRIALHEMMHYSTVGPPSSLGEQIKDGVNADDEPAYDPPRTHGLVDVDQDDNPVLAEQNADSYAWMALDAYVSRICATDPSGDNWATFFQEDPPNYEPVEDPPSDPEDPPSK